MRLKRLVASVSAGFEDFVAKVENHEAVADSMIDEVRRATARVRVQHARVQSQLQRFERQRAELVADEQRWNERALGLADDDEPKALECVRRGRQAAQRRQAIDEQLGQHRGLDDDLKTRLEDLERRLGELQIKRTTLSSRSDRARTVRNSNTHDCESVEAVFERWETSVLADEYRDDLVMDTTDPLEREFRDEETQHDLKARLDELRAARGGES